MKISLQQYAQFLAIYLRPLWRWVLLLTVLLFSNIALQLLNPQIMQRFIDAVQAGQSMDLLLRMAGLFLAIAIVQQIISVSATYVSEVIGWTATNSLRNKLAEYCLSLDLSFHNAHTPGEMIERIDGDATALSNFFAQFIISFVGNALLLAGILVLLFAVDWRVGLVLTIFTIVTLAVAIRFRDITVPYWEAERQASADLFGFLEERLAGTEDIRANGAQAYVMQRFYLLMRDLLKRSLAAAFRLNILLNVMWTLFAVGNALAFAAGAYLFLGKTITIGTVYLIFQYTSMLQRPIDAIVHQMQDLQRAGAGMVRILGLLNIKNRINDPEPQPSHVRETFSLPATDQTMKSTPNNAVEVIFDHVSFGYHDTPAQASHDPVALAPATTDFVLRDLSFHLAPGAVLGLLGRTGSGKTSLTRLLFRLYDPDQGMVRLGAEGQIANIREIPLTLLRRQVGMIAQNIQLFNASVRDNLTFFDPAIADEMILQSLHDLGLRDWYKNLPKGLDTELESGSAGLSAGEAQLLAFTRIFLRDPGLVILDEASSRLDPATERLVENAVDRLVQGRTAIIVAHRLATVQRAGEIMILEEGRILEHAQRISLASDPNSHFHHLLQAGMEEVLA